MSSAPQGWYAEPGTRRLVACNPLHGNPLATRDDLVRAVRDLFAPLKPWFSQSGARIQLNTTGVHYSNTAAELEAFARPLWGIIPLVAGGGDFADLDLYLKGIAAGVDPADPDYWGPAGPLDQRMVEMAVFGVALLLAPDRFWTPLGPDTQARLARWLLSINDHPTADNNWRFFRVLVNTGLRQVGAAHSLDAIRSDLARLDGFYRDEGWYRDGDVHHLDWYIPFAMHFYALIFARFGADIAPEFVAATRDRAARFAQGFQYWFGDDGAAIPFGRSMTYRFAQAAFWAGLAFADLEALPWGRIKGLFLRNLRWWSEQPIAERDGVLSIGYAYPNLLMSEQYNAHGSPYWAMKAFLALAVPADHPFWRAEEEPASALPGGVRAEPTAGFLLRRSGGEAVALSAGQDGRFPREPAAKYEKLAYSSVFAFSVRADADSRFGPDSTAYDSTITLSADGTTWLPRGPVETYGIKDGLLHSLWRTPLDAEGTEAQVTTWQDFAGAGWHVRLHRVVATLPVAFAETGFSIDRTGDGNATTAGWIDIGPGTAFVHPPFGTSGLVDLTGPAGPSREGRILRVWPNANLRFPRTVLPQLTCRLEPGVTLLATAVYARAGRGETPPLELGTAMRKLLAEHGIVVP